jgi:DNA-binding SARP family transcriptional activator
MGNPTTLSVQVLGPFAVARDGVTLPARELASRKGRTLLKLLVARRGAVVPADVVAETLWGDRPPADPDANLATLVSRLRSVVGVDTIAGDRRGWRFVAGQRVVVDLDEAERLTAEAEARLEDEPALALAAAGQALDLLGRGPVMADEPDADWAEPARREAERLAGRARRAAWRAALAVGDLGGALEHARAAVAADPLDETAHRAVMLAHARAGEAAAALAAYERLRETLAEELGADPGPETQALHLALLRGDPLPDALGDAPGSRAGGRAGPEATGGAAPSGAAGRVGAERATGRAAAGPGPPAGGPRLHAASRAPARPGEVGVVGREVELGELAAAWGAGVARRPGLVLVTGEAGIGKTRLVQEAAELARSTGGLVAQARCYEAERSLFLQPLAEAVRAVALALPPARLAAAAGSAAGPLAELVPEIRRVLDPPPYDRAAPELERRRSFEAVTAFARGLAAQQPLLLAVDDLHQAGASTLELLHFLVRRLAGDRLLVVATVRAEEGAEALAALAGAGRVLELGPLPPPAVAELARRYGVAELATPVLERTRGHTLFVVEALRAAAEGDRQGPAGVPASLRDAVLARVRRTGPEVETLLRAAVVVGAAFDLEVVADLLGVPVEEAAARAERALAARLLVEAESGAAYELANDLVREVLYDSLPRPTRVARHRRLATLLADRPEAAAGHAAAAGDLPIAAEAWMAAAARAGRFYANRDAERLLGGAVAAAVRVLDAGLEVRARLERGRVRAALGEYQGAFADQERALRLAAEAGDQRSEAFALEQLGWTAFYARDSQAASEVTPRARELAERAAAAPGAAPSALLLAGRIRHAEGDLQGARAAFDGLLAGEHDAATGALGRQYLGLLLEHGDQFAEARRGAGRGGGGVPPRQGVPPHAHQQLLRHARQRQPRRPSRRAAPPGHHGAPARRRRGPDLPRQGGDHRLLAVARAGRPRPRPRARRPRGRAGRPGRRRLPPGPARPAGAGRVRHPGRGRGRGRRAAGAGRRPARPALRLPLAGGAAPGRAGQPPGPGRRRAAARPGRRLRVGQVPRARAGLARPARAGGPGRRPGRRLPARPGRARPGRPRRPGPHGRRAPAGPPPRVPGTRPPGPRAPRRLSRAHPAGRPRRPTPRTSPGRQGRAACGRAATAAIASRRTAARSSTRPATPTVARR